MHGPLSPAPINGAGRKELPAYVSNGIIGLRIGRCPSAQAWPLSMAIRVNTRSGASKPPPSLLTDGRRYSARRRLDIRRAFSGHGAANNPTISRARQTEQRDFNSRWGATWRRSRFSPFAARAFVCQKAWVECDTAARVRTTSIVDARNVDGIAVRELRETPGEERARLRRRLFGRAPAGYRSAASPM